MTYAIIILSVALWGAFWWILGLKSNLKSERKESKYFKDKYFDEQTAHAKEQQELWKDIRTLIEGGLIEQEAIEAKYKELFEKERRIQQSQQRIYQNQRQAMYNGLQGLGSFHPFPPYFKY